MVFYTEDEPQCRSNKESWVRDLPLASSMRKIIGVTSKFTTASLYACSTGFQHNSSCRLRVDEKPKLPVHRRNRIRVDRAEALGAHVGDACVRVRVRSAASTREWAFKDHGQNSTTK